MEEVLDKEEVKIGYGEPNIKRTVFIRPKAPSTTVPKELHSEIRIRIGSKFKKGTKSPLMGLTAKERKFFLPEIIGVSPDSVDWNDRVKKYYANLTINLPPEGIKLDLSTEDDGSYVVPEDYIIFKQMEVDNTVANNPELMNQTHVAYLVDPEKAKKLEKSLNDQVDILDRLYLKLVHKDDNGSYTKVSQIDSILRMFNVNPATLHVDDKVMKLRNFKQLSVNSVQEGVNIQDVPFYQHATDKMLEKKAFIQQLVTAGAVVMHGVHFVDAEDNGLVLGKNLDEAAAFINDENNSAKIVEYQRIANK